MSRSRRPHATPYAARACWRCERRSCRCARSGEISALRADERELVQVLDGIDQDARERASIAGALILASFDVTRGRVKRFPVWLDGPEAD